MSRRVLGNCDVYTGADVLTESAIVVENDTIVSLIPLSAALADPDFVDLQGLCVSPGFVDIQINGGGDRLFNDAPTDETIHDIGIAHRRLGTTHWLPTLLTTREEVMLEAIAATTRSVRADRDGVLGIHLEGPLLNPIRSGVHDRDLMVDALSEQLLAAMGASTEMVRIMTVAPEVIDMALLRRIVDTGTKVAVGHSDASAAVACVAISNGANLATHLFNAMSQVTAREAGVVGAFLGDDEAYVSVVADGLHVSFETIRVALNAKPAGRVLLITDAMPPVGGTTGHYFIGSTEVNLIEGRCVTKDGLLAGSALDLATAIRNLVQIMGVPKDEAIRMATLYPATYLGVSQKFGRIATGYAGSLAIFDNEMHVHATMHSGELEMYGQV
jgi:N-acetylglucosamine-6-phosphate deacetylase